jgi:hypothetical protein
MRVPWRRDPLAKTTDGAIDPELDSRIHRAFRLRIDSLARVRGDILAEFSAASTGRVATHRNRRWMPVAGVAMMLVVVAAGAAAFGSGPGGPLYAWRQTAESLTLPADASNARYEAELRYLDARFVELTAAVSAGRSDAAKAAGDAYRAALADLISMSSTPGIDRDRLGTMLARESGTLASLSDTAPASTAGFLAQTRSSVGTAEGTIGGTTALPPGQGNVGPVASSEASGGAVPSPTPTSRPGHGNGQGGGAASGGATGKGGGGGTGNGGGTGIGHAGPTPAPATTTDCSAPSLAERFTGNGKGAKAHQMTLTGTYGGDPAPSTWTWGFGDAASSGSGQTVKHDFPAAGTYEVTLTVASSACGTSSTSSTVTVP